MRFWAVALWLLTLLPVLGDSSDVAMGAKSAAVMSASDGQVPEVTKNTVTDAESDSGNGILSAVHNAIVLQPFSEYADIRLIPLRGLIQAYSIRGPLVFS